MTVLTGSFTIFYQTILGKIAIFFILIGLLGLFVSFLVLIKIGKIKNEIDLLIKEIGELDA